MSACKYERGDYKCPWESDKTSGDGFCVFHSPDPKKDQEAFEKTFPAHREKHGAMFIGFVFPASFTFRDTKFIGDANFTDTKFTGDANFTGARFGGDAYFGSAKFSGYAGFEGAEFRREAWFNSAEFSGVADFECAKFIGMAQFGDAKFSGEAQFMEAKFREEAWFMQAKFIGMARFGGAEFREWAKCGDAEFRGEAWFMQAKFRETADFGRTKFGEDTQFGYTEFRKEAWFGGAKFSGEADFTGAEFSGYARFSGSRFLNRTLFISGKRAECDFSGAVIDLPDGLIFRDVDLTRCRFLGTDLRKAEFVGVTWPKIEISKKSPQFIRNRWPTSWKRFGVYDEDEAEQNDTYPHVEQLYRHLKQNYEDRKDYERASDFHYGEKEMRRKNPETSPGLRFLLTLYWLFSGYGEKWVRPLIWMAGLLAVSTLCYLRWGLLRLKDSGPVLDWTNAWETFLYNFKVMTFLKPSNFEPVGLGGDLIYTAQSILGPILIGLFALAIRQRLKR